MPRTPFYALIERLCDAVGDAEIVSDDQVGRLTDADLATIVEHESTVLADTACGFAVIHSVLSSLWDESLTSVTRPAMIGAAIQGALRAQCRHFLRPLLQLEQERRREMESQEDAERDRLLPLDRVMDTLGLKTLK